MTDVDVVISAGLAEEHVRGLDIFSCTKSSIQMVNQFCAKLTNFEYAFNLHQKLSGSSTHSITDNKGESQYLVWFKSHIIFCQYHFLVFIALFCP